MKPYFKRAYLISKMACLSSRQEHLRRIRHCDLHNRLRFRPCAIHYRNRVHARVRIAVGRWALPDCGDGVNGGVDHFHGGDHLHDEPLGMGTE